MLYCKSAHMPVYPCAWSNYALMDCDAMPLCPLVRVPVCHVLCIDVHVPVCTHLQVSVPMCIQRLCRSAPPPQCAHEPDFIGGVESSHATGSVSPCASCPRLSMCLVLLSCCVNMHGCLGCCACAPASVPVCSCVPMSPPVLLSQCPCPRLPYHAHASAHLIRYLHSSAACR